MKKKRIYKVRRLDEGDGFEVKDRYINHLYRNPLKQDGLLKYLEIWKYVNHPK